MDSNSVISWEQIWQEICSDKAIIEEYRIAFLLNVFQKICSRMENDLEYRKYINKLFLQSFSKLETTNTIIKQSFNILLSDDDIAIVYKWFDAYRKKNSTRKTIHISIKKALYEKQQGVCSVCGNKLGNDWSRIHTDHIIPWKLVGDELDNNYQLLCNTCNECKSAKTDYIFKKLINLV